MSERMSKRLRVDDDSLKNQIDSLLNSTEVPLITVSDKEPILVDETTRPKILPPKERNKRFFKSKCKGNGIDDTLENPKDSSLEITVNEPAIDALNSFATVICAENNPSESALLMNIPKKKHLRLLKAEIESQQMPALKVEAPVIITLVEETIIPKMKRKSFDAKDLSEPQEGTPKVFQKKNKLLKISTEDIDSGSRRTTRKSTRNDSGRDKKEDTTVAKELNKNLTIKETVEPSLKKLKMDVRIKTPEEPTAKKIKLDEFAMKTDKLDEPVVKKLKVIETLRILENSEVSKKIEQTVCTETSPIAIAVEASQNEIYSIESQKELPEPTESMLIKASGELNSLNDLCVTPNALKDELSIEINGNVVDEQKPIKISSTDIKDTMESPPTLPETIDIPTEDTSENKPSENVTACEAILEPDVTKIKPIIKTRVQHESNKRKKGLKMSSEKMDEMKRLGFIVDQPHGKKILTATGLKRLRQENILAKSKRKQSGSSSTSGQNEEISETNISSAVVETKEESFSLACENNTSTEIEVIPEQIETKEPEQPVEEVVALEDICAEESIDELKKDELNHSGDSQTVQDSTQILALPADNFGGPINSYYLCTMGEDGMAPINNILYSYMEETKQLVPFEEPPESGSVPDSSDEGIGDETEVTTTDIAILPPQIAPTNIVIDTPDGQNIMLDQQMLLTLVSQGETSQILTSDGQPISQLNDILAAIANNELNVVEDTQEIMIPDIINQNLTVIKKD